MGVLCGARTKGREWEERPPQVAKASGGRQRLAGSRQPVTGFRMGSVPAASQSEDSVGHTIYDIMYAILYSVPAASQSEDQPRRPAASQARGRAGTAR